MNGIDAWALTEEQRAYWMEKFGWSRLEVCRAELLSHLLEQGATLEDVTAAFNSEGSVWDHGDILGLSELGCGMRFAAATDRGLGDEYLEYARPEA